MASPAPAAQGATAVSVSVAASSTWRRSPARPPLLFSGNQANGGHGGDGGSAGDAFAGTSGTSFIPLHRPVGWHQLTTRTGATPARAATVDGGGFANWPAPPYRSRLPKTPSRRLQAHSPPTRRTAAPGATAAGVRMESAATVAAAPALTIPVELVTPAPAEMVGPAARRRQAREQD